MSMMQQFLLSFRSQFRRTRDYNVAELCGNAAPNIEEGRG